MMLLSKETVKINERQLKARIIINAWKNACKLYGNWKFLGLILSTQSVALSLTVSTFSYFISLSAVYF